MMIEPKWILIILLLPLSVHATVQCDHNSWNDNLTQFNQLESNYNQYVTIYNTLLNEHKQRKLLSQTFSLEELTLLWQSQANQNIFRGQLQASIQYRDELRSKAEKLKKLSKESKWTANGWQKLAVLCQKSGATANQVSAEWYRENANLLAEDYTQLALQYAGLAGLYAQEVETLKQTQNITH
ncbi:ATPase [Vibrio alfacsensis]|uniref:ATPase n=1 Tax=Vibrio alfacsensis TaxID=1074311 RepID=UPI004068AF2C